MSSISTGMHLAINILSTLLLAASNYAIQCLIAATRGLLTVSMAEDVGWTLASPIFGTSKRRQENTRSSLCCCI